MTLTPSARVNITLDIDNQQNIRHYELPFKLLCLGPYAGDTSEQPLPYRPPITLQPYQFQEAMNIIKPSVKIPIEGKNTLIEFQELNDFHPDSLVLKVPALKKYIAMRQLLTEFKAHLQNKH